MSELSLNEEISKEVELLKAKHYLEPDDTIDNIEKGIYESENWADTFWRRRQSHAQRPDPEIEVIFDYNPSSVLEIGAAYGRILKKLGEERKKRKSQAKLFGIEKCLFLEKYFSLYKQEEKLDQDINIFYDDFFNSTKLKDRKFDIIALTMNTFPEFGLDGIPMLFKTAEKYLTENGRFMFSSYKINEEEPLENLLKVRNGSELSYEKGENPLVLEFYQFKKLLPSNEVLKIGYQVHYRFSDFYKTREKKIYRNTGLLLRRSQIEQKIQENRFVLEDIRSDQYSYVFICKKRT